MPKPHAIQPDDTIIWLLSIVDKDAGSAVILHSAFTSFAALRMFLDDSNRLPCMTPMETFGNGFFKRIEGGQIIYASPSPVYSKSPYR